MKSNPCEAILKDVNKRLGTFDCASKSEIAQVLKIGGQANKIVFSNPVKEEMDLVYANHKGVQLTIADTIVELIKITQYAPNMKILWRLSIQENVSDQDTELKNGVFSGKFGDDFTDLDQAKERFDEIYHMGIKLHGIHFHCGTSVQGSQSFGKAVDLARECLRIGRECGHSMEILDIGGGFPQGEIHESAKIALRKTYKDPLGYQVISEPGRHFSSNTCYLLFKVMSKRIKKNQICYHVNDSLYHSFNCILTDSKKFEKETVQIYDVVGSKSLEEQTMVSCSMFGMTCDGIDVISHEIILPNNLSVGDWLCISGMGSYTLGSKSNFNGMKATTKIIKWKQREVSSSDTL